MNAQEIEAALRTLLDKDEIVDLVHRYSYLFDHGRQSEVPSLFTEDCVVDYGPGIAPVINGRDQLVSLLSSGDSAGFLGTSHHNANVLVAFDGADRADVVTSLYAWHHATSGPNPRVWGYYYDTVVRTIDGWRISRRQLRVSGQENFPVEWHPLVYPG